MSKFTKQYTTKEQSERLLKLGIPAWTADCYYLDLGLGDYSDNPKFGVGEDDSLPCWSTGRLIELFNACECYDDIVELSAVPEEIIKEIDDAIMDEVFDLDKLEEYKND